MLRQGRRRSRVLAASACVWRWCSQIMLSFSRSCRSVVGSDALLMVLDEESGLAVPTRCPVASLVTHSHLFGVAVSAIEHLYTLASAAEHVVSILGARRVVANLLLLWQSSHGSDLVLGSGDGADAVAVADVLSLVKLSAAAEDAFRTGKVATGHGLVSSAEGGKVLPATSPTMGALQVLPDRRGVFGCSHGYRPRAVCA